MTGDKAIRYTATCAVLTVAAVAAAISFGHIETVALTHGQPLMASRALPLSVDGAVVAASMVLLDAARRAVQAPVLARVMLGAGVAATLGANAISGAGHGPVGVAVAMLPAASFIGSVEVLLAMIRGRSGTAETAHETASEGVPETALAGEYTVATCVPEDAGARTRRAAPRALSPSASHRRTPSAPEVIFAEELSAGTVPGIRSIKTRCKVGQPKAEAIQARIATLVSEPAATIS